MSDCIFCAIVAGTAPAQIIDSDERTIAFLDINPATPGHTLVIPRRHHTDLLEIDDVDLAACTSAARRLALRIEDRLDAEGFNLINACRPVAWQTVFHFHIHLIPRYSDDALKLPWVPRAGDPAEIARVADLLGDPAAADGE